MQDPLVDFLTKPCLAHSATVAPKHFFRSDGKKKHVDYLFMPVHFVFVDWLFNGCCCELDE